MGGRSPGSTPSAGSVGWEQLLIPFEDAEAAPRRPSERSPLPSPIPPRAAPCERPRPRASATGDPLRQSCDRLYPRKRVTIRYDCEGSRLATVFHRPDGTVELRAASAFRGAPSEVADALVRMHVGRPRRVDRQHLSHVVHSWQLIDAAPPPSVAPEQLRRGRIIDLDGVRDGVLARDFAGEGIEIDIGFAARVARWTMGRYERRAPKSLILINPLLDHRAIERWYLEYLVFHECLHHVVPPERRAGKIAMHPPAFRARERRHPHFDRVKAYEQWITSEAWPRLRRDAKATD